METAAADTTEADAGEKKVDVGAEAAVADTEAVAAAGGEGRDTGDTVVKAIHPREKAPDRSRDIHTNGRDQGDEAVASHQKTETDATDDVGTQSADTPKNRGNTKNIRGSRGRISHIKEKRGRKNDQAVRVVATVMKAQQTKVSTELKRHQIATTGTHQL